MSDSSGMVPNLTPISIILHKELPLVNLQIFVIHNSYTIKNIAKTFFLHMPDF